MQPTADAPSSTPSKPREPLPQQIGRYRILEQLGEGGMGTVYKAHDPDLDRVVALKLPRFEGPLQDRLRRVQRFQREARAAAQIWHPHVCPIFDVGEHEGQSYVVMAYVEGRSLAERLAGQPRYDDILKAVGVVLQILDALGAVHAHGIVHRDLKPGNILIDPAGRAVLTDFGLARPENDAEHLTSDGIIVGTPAYMAPEQATGESERIGPWTDLYSLGVVLYQMLTGRLPFLGTSLNVLAKIVHEAPPPPSGLRPDLPQALEMVILKVLTKDPEQRYQSAPQFAADLEAWCSGTLRLTSSEATLAKDPLKEVPQFQTAATAAIPPRRGISPKAGFVAGGVSLAVGLLLSRFPKDTVALTVGMLFFLFSVPCLGWSIFYWPYDPKALIEAAATGRARVVRRLIRQGVALDARDETGETALMKAAANGHADIVKILLIHGANPHEKTVFGDTTLMMANAKGHKEIVEFLKKAGARE